ncbi:hypothetical protein [Paenibacillus sp. GXUN7292]|uniref:hypothetical protein n=1 Tax=Paenibacillus sp. GXUN7292 TaxID=3422499 RepID=UPI003D7D5487
MKEAVEVESFFDSFDSGQMALRFRTIIMARVSEGIPEGAVLLGLLSEMSASKRSAFLQRIGLTTKVKSNDQIVLLIRARSKTKNAIFSFYFALLLSLYEILEEFLLDETNPNLLIERESIIRASYGNWHFYFALKFHPNYDEILEERIRDLYEELMAMPVSEVESIAPKQERNSDLVQKERSKRIQLQEVNDKLQSQVKELTKSSAQFQKQNKEIREQNEVLKQQSAELEAKIRKEYLRANEAEIKIRQVETRSRDLEWEIDDKLREKDNEILNLQKQLLATRERNYLLRQVEALLRADARALMTRGTGSAGDAFTDVCAQLQECLSLMKAIEQYSSKSAVETAVEIEPASEVTVQSESNDSPATGEPLEVASLEEGRIGKFVRRPHGGVIEFGDDTTVFITESVVQAVGVEHEAIVSYAAKEGGGHHVSLIMQGDDSSSPVQQLLGFVRLGDYHEFYCVDVNTNNSYKLHQKDVDYLTVRDGEPCLFNVMEGYQYARIARMYRNESTNGIDDLQKKHAQEASQRKTAKPTEVIEKFLTGCKIVIVGGLEKWFASTVEMTGAELIHNSGHHPQRVFSDIKKANALFLLLTANSHKATWGAIEEAKKYNVPHFTIQGSRSNLLSLLWDNREFILGNQ